MCNFLHLQYFPYFPNITRVLVKSVKKKYGLSAVETMEGEENLPGL